MTPAIAAVVVVAFLVGIVIGRLSARFVFQWTRDEPIDHVSHSRLVQIRRM